MFDRIVIKIIFFCFLLCLLKAEEAKELKDIEVSTSLNKTIIDYTELVSSLTTSLTNYALSIDVNSVSYTLAAISGLLLIVKAAMKAPLLTLYQISTEIVVMVALSLFISYLGAVNGVDVLTIVDNQVLAPLGFSPFFRRSDDENMYESYSALHAFVTPEPVTTESSFFKRSLDTLSFFDWDVAKYIGYTLIKLFREFS